MILSKMNHFINLKDIKTKDLRKIILDAKKRKNLRKTLNTLEVDKGSPLKGKILKMDLPFEAAEPSGIL